MKLSSTFLGAIAIAQADDHPGIFKKSKYKLIKNSFQIFLVLVSRMKNPTEFFLFILEKPTALKSAWQVAENLIAKQAIHSSNMELVWSITDLLMPVSSSKPNAIAVRNQQMDSIHCTPGLIGVT